MFFQPPNQRLQTQSPMKRISLPVFLVSALALAASPLTGCTGNRGGKKEEAAAAGPAAAGGGLVTMDQVDDSLNSKITGERFRVTYNDKDQVKGAADPL